MPVSDTRVAKFLRGESIEDDSVSDGYVAILVDGYPLGFGKAKGGVIKNHYPKGIRNLT
jgi:NOL1/NOP2/fmu family ribosome biogenesis protein